MGGVYTPLASTPFTVSAGSWYTVKLEMIGANLKVYVNGTLQLSATDGSIASGSIAVWGYNSSAEYDKVVVTSESGGANPPPGPISGVRRTDKR